MNCFNISSKSQIRLSHLPIHLVKVTINNGSENILNFEQEINNKLKAVLFCFSSKDKFNVVIAKTTMGIPNDVFPVVMNCITILLIWQFFLLPIITDLLKKE